MNRFNRRASRILIGVLSLVVTLVGVSIYYNSSGANSLQAAGPSPSLLPSGRAETRSIQDLLPATQPAAPAPQATTRADQQPQLPTTRHLADRAVVASAATAPSLDWQADAKARISAGRLIEARAILNDQLQNPGLGESDAASVKASIAEISKTVVFGRQRFEGDAFALSQMVKPGDALAKIAAAHDCTWQFLARINGIPDERHLRAGVTLKLIQGPFFAVVDKKKFSMDLYLGGLPGERSSMYVTSFAVGLGRDDSTPAGTWMVEPHHKISHPTYYSPRGEGVIDADDPKNPLGGYWIGLTGTGGEAVDKLSYGIHGTIEPDSIGKQASLGCIRMHNEDIALVFDMLVEGKSLVLVK